MTIHLVSENGSAVRFTSLIVHLSAANRRATSLVASFAACNGGRVLVSAGQMSIGELILGSYNLPATLFNFTRSASSFRLSAAARSAAFRNW
jgi:hypothetical protein